MSNEQLLKQVREAIDILEATQEIVCRDNEKRKSLHNTSLLALRFMEKMLGEPSDDMWSAGENTIELDAEYQECFRVSTIFEAMVQQALNELEDERT